MRLAQSLGEGELANASPAMFVAARENSVLQCLQMAGSVRLVNGEADIALRQ